MEAISNEYIVRCVRQSLLPNNRGIHIAKSATNVRDGILHGKAPSFWSLHFGLYGILGSRLNIIPKYNLISNIGLTGCVFFGEIYELPEKLILPEYIIDDQVYMKRQDAIMNPSCWVRFIELPERIYRTFFVK